MRGWIPVRTAGVAFILALVALVSPPAGASVDAFTPVAAFAVGERTSALVTWIPATQPPDAYVIYGVTAAGALVGPIATAPGAAVGAFVPGAYAGYAVAAEVGADVSSAVVALLVQQGCVNVDTNPPAWYISCSGPSGVPRPVHAEGEIDLPPIITSPTWL